MRENKYRGFKKVSENEHHAIMRHPAGHEIKIAKKNLSPELHKQLSALPIQKLAKGGEVSIDTAGDASRLDAGFGKVIVKTSKVKDDSGVQKFADGGEAERNIWDNVLTAASSPQMAPLAASMSPEGKEQLPQSPVIPRDTPETLQAEKAAASPDAALVPESADVSQPNIPQTPNMPVDADPLSKVNDSQIAGLKSGFGQQQAGVNAAAKAEGDLGTQEQATLQKGQADLANLQAHYQDQSQKVQSEMDNVSKDYLAGHIDPARFWNSKTDLGKFSTAFGLILGGLGASFTGHNPALEFLNHQIDRDIEAQKAEFGKKDNLLTHLHQQFGDITSAAQAAKAMQLDVLDNQLKMAAAQAKGPLAQASALKASGEIQMQKAQILQPLIMRQAVLKGMDAGHINPSMAVSVLVPKEDQAAAHKELGEVNKLEQGHTMMRDKMNELYEINKHPTAMVPGTDANKARNQVIVSIKGIAHDLYNKTSDQELSMIDSAIPNMSNDKDAYNHFAESMYKTTKAKVATPVLDGYPMIKNSLEPKGKGFNKR